jgi:hypothetical protein
MLTMSFQKRCELAAWKAEPDVSHEAVSYTVVYVRFWLLLFAELQRIGL